jgi:poly(beta-D-mannuronate) lyase
MRLFSVPTFGLAASLVGLCFATQAFAVDKNAAFPSQVFDLSHWDLTLPLDKNKDKKVDTISVKKLQKYSHPDFFYLNENNELVFTSPNKALSTKNSSNTRSELRYVLAGDKKISKRKAPQNFVVAAHTHADKFGSKGGKMEATLRVNHVAVNAENPDKKPAFSAVVGQIHAVHYDDNSQGFGYGNEPLKIYYKKWPNHDTGSVFWNYERNLPKEDKNRKDISYPVWGNTWENPEDPGAAGIALGEEFSYTVNVHGNIMYLTFTSPGKETVTYEKSLLNNIDGYGKRDLLDNKFSYYGDAMYFKAGVYNQCTAKSKKSGFWYANCGGTGDWETDKANGDYAQATFSRLVVGPSTPPN